MLEVEGAVAEATMAEATAAVEATAAAEEEEGQI